MGNEPIRQHKVPRCYLKKFATSQKKDWYADVYDLQAKTYIRANIRNLCVESEFYTFSNLPEEKRRILERFYGNKVETSYPIIYDQLINPSVKKLDRKERLQLLAFVYAQFTRTSKLTNAFNSMWNDMLERGHSLLDPSQGEQKIHFDEGGFIDFAGRSLKEVQQAEMSSNKDMINIKNLNLFLDLNRRRLGDLITVYKFPPSDLLITSDNPVLSSGFMFDPASHFEMPLDKEHLLLLLPANSLEGKDNKIVQRSMLKGDMANLHATYSNLRQMANAERYVIGSRSIIEQTLIRNESFDPSDFETRSKKVIDSVSSIDSHWPTNFEQM